MRYPVSFVPILVLLACLSVPATGQEARPDITRGVVGYMPLDGSLELVAPDGAGTVGAFSRASRAYDDALNVYEIHVPRYLEGRFGRGIRIEPGYEGRAKPNARNHLGRPAAEMIEDATGKLGWSAVGGAQLQQVTGKPGAHVGTDAPVLEGGESLKVTCGKAGDGIVSVATDETIPGTFTVSFFARTEGAAAGKLKVELLDPEGKAVDAGEVDLADKWSRVNVMLNNGKFSRSVKKEDRKPLTVRITAAAPLTFRIDGVVLEMNHGYSYAGAYGASSWLPGHGYRASEELTVNELAPVFEAGAGSVAFWCKQLGHRQGRRTLFELGTGNRWSPVLLLSLDQQRFLSLSSNTGKGSGRYQVDFPTGAWHHVALAWNETSATVFLDGKKLGTVEGLKLATNVPAVRLGSSGPNSPGDVVLDDVVFYNRPISEAEAGVLASREQSLAEVMTPAVSIVPNRFVAAIARSFEMQRWRGKLVNHTEADMAGLTLRMTVGTTMTMERTLARLAAGAEAPFEFNFMVDLPLGTYPLRVVALRGGAPVARFERTVEITPTAEPFENLQVSTWGFTSKREYGLTMGGGDIEDTMRKRQYLNPHLHYLCYPTRTTGPEYMHGIDDKQFRPRLDHPYIVKQIDDQAERFAMLYADLPAMKSVIVNTEMQWLWQHDYAPDRIAWVKKTFGLDLEQWHNTKKGEGEHVLINPYGRLRPSYVGMTVPDGGVVPLDHPFYAYHRWFHGSMGPTESYLNQTLSVAINRERPDILTVQEPILRRPAVKAFDRMQIGQEWYYYQNPMTAVMVQERLAAATRGTPLRFTGMPQFLFKENTAAPFAGPPTADLYHQTSWLCALQPIRKFTYWNFNVVPEAGYENAYHITVTKQQLDELLGSPTPTWDQAKKALADKAKSEDKDQAKLARKMFPWTPELIETFTRFHTEEVGPLGTLITHWQNRPRKVAVVTSFANQLWHEVRWPTSSWLENNAIYSGVPFDVLYDNDFETDADVLKQYAMVIVSRTVAITKPAYDKLVAYANAGGTLVVDDATTVRFPKVVNVAEPVTLGDLKSILTDLLQEVRKEKPRQTERARLLTELIRNRTMLPKEDLVQKLTELGADPLANPQSQFFKKLDLLRKRVEAAPLSGVDFTDKLKELEAELTAKYGGPDNFLFLEDMSKAEFIRQLPDRVSEQYKGLLDTVVKPEARSLTPNTWLNVLQAEGAHYIGVVNDLRTVGSLYGHFGRVREKGVPQTAEVRYNKALGSVVYDLLQNKRLQPVDDGQYARLKLPIEGGGARVLMLTDRPIERLTVGASVTQATWGDHTGKQLTVTANLTDAAGNAVAGMVPATVTVVRPDGTESDWSRHHVITGGKLTMSVPVTVGVEGAWTVKVFERASGKTATATFKP